MCVCVERESERARESYIKPHINGKSKIYSRYTHTQKKKESKHNTKDSHQITKEGLRTKTNPKQLTKWQCEHTYQ